MPDENIDAQAPANIPDGVADAVDVLVAEHGVDGAEKHLKEKFSERHDRAVAALGYLRYKYREATA